MSNIDKTAMLAGWLVGRKVAGMMLPQKKEPIAYLYNGTMRLKVPTRDANAYPYLMVYDGVATTYAYACSKPVIGSKNAIGGSRYTFTAPFLRCEIVYDLHGHDYWSEWEVVESETSTALSSNIWSSHSIYTAEGALFHPADDEPTPVYLPIVLYDGEVITTQPDYADHGSCSIPLLFEFASGDTLRITINGDSGVYTAEIWETSNSVQIGNAGLNGNDLESPDDGGDWLVVFSGAYVLKPKVYFYTRNPGTYQVKIELIAMGKS